MLALANLVASTDLPADDLPYDPENVPEFDHNGVLIDEEYCLDRKKDYGEALLAFNGHLLGFQQYLENESGAQKQIHENITGLQAGNLEDLRLAIGEIRSEYELLNAINGEVLKAIEGIRQTEIDILAEPWEYYHVYCPHLAFANGQNWEGIMMILLKIQCKT